MKNGIIVLCLVFTALTACNISSVSFAPSLSKQIEQRKNVMLDSANRTYSNAERWDVIEAFTKALEDSTAIYQSKIDSILIGPAREAYTAEREALSRWYDYQNVVARDVVVEIWQLYIGGTAGGTLYEMHLYDRANANMTEQEILFNALTKQSYASLYQPRSSIEEIQSAKDSLICALNFTYSIIDNEDNWRYLDHSADDVDGFIANDYFLFQEWLSARKALEMLLNPHVRNIYSSQTRYWQDMFLQTLRGKYIHESD